MCALAWAGVGGQGPGQGPRRQDPEIMIWAEGRYFTGWATTVPAPARRYSSCTWCCTWCTFHTQSDHVYKLSWEIPKPFLGKSTLLPVRVTLPRAGGQWSPGSGDSKKLPRDPSLATHLATPCSASVGEGILREHIRVEISSPNSQQKGILVTP